MADWYWTPFDNTNPTGNGTSYAQRTYKFSTVAAAAAGDRVKVGLPDSYLSVYGTDDPMNPYPRDTGQTATWTNGSLTVTLASAVTQNIYTDGTWTSSAGASVTCTANSAAQKEGANCASIAVAGSFTTGQAAYFDTGTLDLSSYTMCSYWARSSVAYNAASILLPILALCANIGGGGSQIGIGVPQSTGYLANTWRASISSLSGTPSSRTSIDSVSLTFNSDPGTPTWLFDNIVACMPASSTLGLNHNTLISTSASGPWYPIKSINGTTVVIDNHTNSLAGQGRGYWGPTGTFPLWKREPFLFFQGSNGFAVPEVATTAMFTGMNNSGSAGNPITISWGWSQSSQMTLQADTHYFTNTNGAGNLMGTYANRSFTNTENVVLVRGNSFATFNSSNSDFEIRRSGVIGCTASPALAPITGQNRVSFIDCIVNNNQTIGFGTASNATNQDLIVRGLKSYNNGGIGFNSAIGTAFSLGYSEVSDVEVANNGGASGFILQNPTKYINNIRAYDNAVTANNGGIDLTRQNFIAFNLTASGHTTTNAGGILAGSNNPRLYNITSTGNNKGIIGGGGALSINCKYNLYNASISGNTTDIGFPTSNLNQGTIRSTGEGGSSSANTIYSTYGNITTDTSVVHTGTYSWKFAPGSTTQATQYAPLSTTIGRIPCNANKTITIKYWARYSHATNIPCQFRIVGGLIAGVGSPGTNITTALSGSADTWAQYTISCTPTVDCVIEVLFDAYISSGSGHVAYVDGAVEVT